MITQIAREELGVDAVEVEAREGGNRGMMVTVRLPDSGRSSAVRVRQALAPFLFEVEVAG